MSLSIALGVLLSGGSVIDLDGTIFIQVLLYFIAFFLLRSLVIRPVLGILDAREQAIDGTKAEAQKLQSDAESKRLVLEEELRKVWEQANQERDQLRVKGQHQARQLIEKTRKETEGMLSQAKSKFDAEGDKLRSELKGVVPGLARQIASRLLDREVS